ncbi:MAG TPA: glycosyltransferase family 4 protein [Candidatus Saccharimonadales bacterium]|nr:glycosyltransferase family 4 protein [Candidatus Saccharimonadales bacterium]
MNILHVTKKYPPALGGDAVVVANLEKQQVAAGHVTTVLTSNCDEIPADAHIVKAGFRAKTASALDAITPTRILSLVSFFLHARRIIKAKHIDIIHSHSPDMGFAVSFAARMAGVPMVHTCHGLTFPDKRYSFVKRLLERFFLKHAAYQKIIVLGEQEVQACKQAGISQAVFVPNGVDTTFWQAARRNAGKQPVTFVAVGRLEAQKRFDLLLDAAAALRSEGNDFRVVIVGDGSLRQELNAQAARLGIGDIVTFTGAQSPEHIRQLHRDSDVFVLSSAWEGFPLTVLEAMAMGQAVIATDVGSVKAIAGTAVHIIPPEDAQALHTAMRHMLTQPAARKKLAAAGQSLAQHYSWQTIAATTTGLYQAAMDRTIVQVVGYYPPHLGGVEQRVRSLTQHLAGQGHKVVVLTSAIGSKAQTSQEGNLTVKYLRGFEFAHTPFMLSLPFHVWRQATKRSVIHVHIAQAFVGEIVAAICMLKRKPYIAHFRMDADASGFMGAVLPLYKKLFLGPVLRHAARVIVLTPDYSTIAAGKFGVQPERIAVIPNATEFTIASKPKQQAGTPLQLLFVGRLAKQKNPHLAIAAAARIKHAHLTIVGTGELQQELEAFVAERGLTGSVTFAGLKTGKHLEDAYAKADIFMMTSRAESFGTVIIEAMAKGVPIVASDIPAVRNTVHTGRNGFLLPQDATSFADAITQLATDAALYARCSQANVADVQAYSWDQVVARTLTVYGDVR